MAKIYTVAMISRAMKTATEAAGKAKTFVK
jgi:hypothetical protein